MKLSIENLKQGMEWWQQGKWPEDYLNHDYYTLYQDRAGGLTEQWLLLTVDRLAKWRAFRSRKPPNTKLQIFELLKMKLPLLQTAYQRILDLSKNEPSINTLSWRDVNDLYELMADIKNGSPVFASKLGHFIFPKVFIVMDNLGTEVMLYDYYWQGMVNEWNLFADKVTCMDLLKTEIQKRSTIPSHKDYPYETKVMELCHIGNKWKRLK
jgi:hypothetical protein